MPIETRGVYYSGSKKEQYNVPIKTNGNVISPSRKEDMIFRISF